MQYDIVAFVTHTCLHASRIEWVQHLRTIKIVNAYDIIFLRQLRNNKGIQCSALLTPPGIKRATSVSYCGKAMGVLDSQQGRANTIRKLQFQAATPCPA